MLKKFILTIAIAIPHSALALSCIAPDPLASLNGAHIGGDQLTIGIGSVRPTGRLIDGPVESPMMPYIVDYTFDGVFFEGGEYSANTTETVKFTSSCVGPWCGHAPSFEQGMQYLFIFDKSDDGAHFMDFGPCDNHVIIRLKTTEAFDKLARCAAQGTCVAKDMLGQ